MPPPKAESDYSINFDAIEKCFLRSLIFFAFSRPTTWRGFQKVFESTHKNRPSYSLLSERHWKFSPGRLNFSVFPWPTTWGTNFSGDTHKIDPSHSSLSEGIYRKTATTRKYFLQALIIHRSRDLPLEREKVFSGTPKNIPLNLLASGGVPQEHSFPSHTKEVMHQPTTE